MIQLGMSDMFQDFTRQSETIPAWVPEDKRHYIAHTAFGTSMRELARRDGCHPSTIMRQIRAIESRREDPLLDEAFDALTTTKTNTISTQTMSANSISGPENMTAISQNHETPVDVIEREARRILRRLCESGAVLAVGKGLDMAAVVRQGPQGSQTRTATVARDVAHHFILRDWISCTRKGGIALYEITQAGRAALKRMLAVPREPAQAAVDPFAEQHREMEERKLPAGDRERRVRVNIAESPIAKLARKRGADGKPFLAKEMTDAAERLREDFEIAQLGPRVTQNWDRFLTCGRVGSAEPGGPAQGPEAARDRVHRALAELGPGLGDVALRVCCHLEGLEATEKRLGWSARSGKVVLRIALTRLARHYAQIHG